MWEAGAYLELGRPWRLLGDAAAVLLVGWKALSCSSSMTAIVLVMLLWAPQELRLRHGGAT